MPFPKLVEEAAEMLNTSVSYNVGCSGDWEVKIQRGRSSLIGIGVIIEAHGWTWGHGDEVERVDAGWDGSANELMQVTEADARWLLAESDSRAFAWLDAEWEKLEAD